MQFNDKVALRCFFGTVALALATLLWVGGMHYARQYEDNHHTIISVSTDHPGDRCYMLLDANDRPIQMSCVTGEKPQWSTTTTTAQW